MTTLQIWLLILQGCASTSVLLYIFSQVIKTREEHHRFRLYAVRDRLIWLVATGKLTESSQVFRAFYSGVNASISATDRLTIASLIQASQAARSALQREKQDRLLNAIDRSDPEVRRAIDEFARVMMEIIWANSLLLRAAVMIVRRARRVIGPWPRTVHAASAREQYQTYRYWQKLADHSPCNASC
jgi:hypothetical protein